MPTKKYIVELTEAERDELNVLIHRGKTNARSYTRARILLKSSDGLKDTQIAQELGCNVATIERIRKRFVEEGLYLAIHDHPHPLPKPKLDGAQTAYLTALACSSAPQGRKSWTLRLLAGTMVEMAVVDSLSYETVRKTLKKKSAQALAGQRMVYSRRQS